MSITVTILAAVVAICTASINHEQYAGGLGGGVHLQGGESYASGNLVAHGGLGGGYSSGIVGAQNSEANTVSHGGSWGGIATEQGYGASGGIHGGASYVSSNLFSLGGYGGQYSGGISSELGGGQSAKDSNRNGGESYATLNILRQGGSNGQLEGEYTSVLGGGQNNKYWDAENNRGTTGHSTGSSYASSNLNNGGYGSLLVGGQLSSGKSRDSSSKYAGKSYATTNTLNSGNEAEVVHGYINALGNEQSGNVGNGYTKQYWGGISGKEGSIASGNGASYISSNQLNLGGYNSQLTSGLTDGKYGNGKSYVLVNVAKSGEYDGQLGGAYAREQKSKDIVGSGGEYGGASYASTNLFNLGGYGTQLGSGNINALGGGQSSKVSSGYGSESYTTSNVLSNGAYGSQLGGEYISALSGGKSSAGSGSQSVGKSYIALNVLSHGQNAGLLGGQNGGYSSGQSYFGGHLSNGYGLGGLQSSGIEGGNYGKQVEIDYYAHPKYQFKYGVSDPHTKDNHQQQEQRDGDSVQGEYSLSEPDGTIRTVKYTSDHKTGFNAQVVRSGHAKHPLTHIRPAIVVYGQHSEEIKKGY